MNIEKNKKPNLTIPGAGGVDMSGGMGTMGSEMAGMGAYGFGGGAGLAPGEDMPEDIF